MRWPLMNALVVMSDAIESTTAVRPTRVTVSEPVGRVLAAEMQSAMPGAGPGSGAPLTGHFGTVAGVDVYVDDAADPAVVRFG